MVHCEHEATLDGSDDARQRRAHVYPMDEALEIDRGACVGVDILRRMAHHTEADAAPRPAVRG